MVRKIRHLVHIEGCRTWAPSLSAMTSGFLTSIKNAPSEFDLSGA